MALHVDATPSTNGSGVHDEAGGDELTGEELRAVVLGGQVLNLAQVKQLQPPEPQIEELFFKGGVVVVWGKPASYKSFLAWDWSLCIATGSPWFDRAVAKGRVLYVAAEGASGLARRVDAWQFRRQVWEIEPTDLLVLPRAVSMLDPLWAGGLAKVAGGFKSDLVVIDTVARAMVGGEENASRDMGLLIEAAERIRRDAGATVLLVHHATRDGGNARGHSQLDGAVDTSIEVRADGPVITLRCEKQKDDHEFQPIRLVAVETRESVTLQRSHSAVGQFAERTASEEAVLRAAIEACGTDGLTSSQLQTVAPDVPRSSFYRALKVLVGDGALRNVGSDRRPRYVPANLVAVP